MKIKSCKTNCSRRNMIKTIGMTGALLLSGGIPLNGFCSENRNVQCYDGTLRDGLWMWGHETDTIQGHYNIPKGRSISQSEAVAWLGIPNDCVTRYQGKPVPPFDDFIKQFAKTKRVAWSVIDGAPQPYPEKKRAAFELVDKMPNLTSIFLDDFFKGDAIPFKNPEGKLEAAAHLTVAELKTLHDEIKALKRPVDLTMVLYSNQIRPELKSHFDEVDVVSFWTWNANDLEGLEKNFTAYRKVEPKKRTLLGIYMWDFGNGKPITIEAMEHQCSFGRKMFQEGQIEGMVFHCTPLCGLDLDSVKWSKQWIADNASVTRNKKI